jgi:hypothetical protein
MMTAPATADPVRTPSQSPFTGAVRTFVDTFSLSNPKTASSTDESAAFALVLRPQYYDSLSIGIDGAEPVVVPVDWAMGATNRRNTYHSYQGAFVVDQDYPLNDHSDKTVTSPTLTVVKGSYDRNGTPFLPIVLQSGAKLIVNIVTDSTGGTPASSFAVFQRAAGTTAWGNVTRSADGKFQVKVDQDIDGLMFTTNGTQRAQVFLIPFTADAANVPEFPTYNQHNLFSLRSVELSQVSEYRITAMSILATYSGNEFNNGGVIAAARTRANFAIPVDDQYDALTRLQDHVYRGPAKMGAYAWWLPNSIEELDFRGPREVIPTTDLRVAGVFADASGSLQVTVAMTVEFYSPSQIFEHIPASPMSDEYEAVLHMLDRIPAASCNPSHLDLIKKGIAAAMRVAKKTALKGVNMGVDYLINNPEVIAQGLSVLAAAL